MHSELPHSPNSQTVGERVELTLLGDYGDGLYPDPVDAPFGDFDLERTHTYDAVTPDGDNVNVKAAKVWMAKERADDGTVIARERGRWRVWWEDWCDCDHFLLALYDPERTEPLFHWELLAIDDDRLTEALPDDKDDWYEANPHDSRDDPYYRLNWAHVFDTEEVADARA